MKKAAVLALVLAVGFTTAGAGSIGIPWFVDNAPAGAGLVPANLTSTIIYLNNSSASDVECQIAYFSDNGDPLGPATNNTFVIPGLSTVAFRPVADDEVNATTNPNGQESAVGAAVPNRPLTVSPKKNGSARILYDDLGGTVRITGKAESWGTRSVTGATGHMSINSAFLLPE